MGARAWPVRVPLPRSRRLGLRNSLRFRQSSPPHQVRDRGAATPAGAMKVAPCDGAATKAKDPAFVIPWILWLYSWP